MPRERNYLRECHKLKVIRSNWIDEPADIDPGVKFFILMLEQLGCRTYFSCEGHPGDTEDLPYYFYIIFDGQHDLACDINQCGYFTIELIDLSYYGDCYRLSLDGLELRSPFPDDKARRFVLNKAAQSWVKHFGPLQVLEDYREANHPRSSHKPVTTV